MKTKLRDVLRIRNGTDHKHLPDGNVPVFGSGGIMRYVNKAIYSKPSILLPRKGTLDNIQFAETPFWTVDTIFYTEIDTTKAVPYYLYYLLRGLDMSRLWTGTGVPSMTSETYYNVEINLPDLPTQLRIAGVLGSIDEKIELNRKKIAELETLAKTIYDYWFVQFDFPDKNGKPYKSSGGKMVWNEQLKREVPEGWNIGTIGDMGEIVSGGTPSTSNASYWSSQGIAWITPKDLSVTSNKYIRHGEHDISENGLHNSSAQLMPRKSVMLSTRAPIGYIAVADCDLCTNQGFKSIVPNKNFGSEFIYYAVSAMIPFIKSLGVGSTFAEVSKSSLSSVQSILPPQHICSRFDEIASSIGNERLRCELEIENVVELRDVLLPLLMNGQVVVG